MATIKCSLHAWHSRLLPFVALRPSLKPTKIFFPSHVEQICLTVSQLKDLWQMASRVRGAVYTGRQNKQETGKPSFQHLESATLSWKWEKFICKCVFLISDTMTILPWPVSWVAFFTLTDIMSRTQSSDNPALEIFCLNLLQARLFPTETKVCAGQWAATPRHQSEWALFM